ncbi:integrase core domain-containing protein, partial [Burkholderia sp. LFS061]|uniref:integrase core domain-containing protein n=1 Tax=Burkholderia sp. LFS061 TaxID=3229885 RepID=UPI003A807E41
LKAYESVSHARRSIGEYIELYNRKRPHSSLADQTPDGGILRDAACDQVGSMIASDIPLKNIENLSERARPPLTSMNSMNGRRSRRTLITLSTPHMKPAPTRSIAIRRSAGAVQNSIRFVTRSLVNFRKCRTRSCWQVTQSH